MSNIKNQINLTRTMCVAVASIPPSNNFLNK